MSGLPSEVQLQPYVVQVRMKLLPCESVTVTLPVKLRAYPLELFDSVWLTSSSPDLIQGRVGHEEEGNGDQHHDD